jgi:hypothetical protein
MNGLKEETLRRQTHSPEGSNHENPDDLIPADVCAPKLCSDSVM